MITRAQIRRQLRKNGGIINAVPRQNYGLGSWIKERARKLIPNELADIASKAAPFVAPFYPGYAAAMRGIGRFDKRGSISDAMKQAALTYAGGKGARYLGGAEGASGGPSTYSMEGFREGPVGRTWDRMMPEKKVPIKEEVINKSNVYRPNMLEVSGPIKEQSTIKNLWKKFQGMSPGMRTAIVGVGTGTIAGVAEWFSDQVPQEPGESMEEYMVRRKATVGKLMRTYMDNYYAYDSEYSQLDDAGKDAFVAQYNMKKGGRVGYAMGSPHSETPTFSEGVEQMYMSDDLGALPKAEGGVRPEDMGILSLKDFDNLEDYRRYINKLAYAMAKTEEPDSRLSEKDIMRQLNKLAYGMAREAEPDNTRMSEGDIMRQLNRLSNNKSKGGRIGKFGGGIGAAMPRIPIGVPRVNAGGISELDYRASGGFVPVGVKEKADDVPAMLSKNEFVMTADAVKAAGGGSVEKGAQKMYNTMKQLEGRIA